MANGNVVSCSDAMCSKCQEKYEELAVRLQEQIKVNTELKNLLLNALGSDVGVMIENLAKDKLLLDRELSECKSQMEKGADDIDNLSAAADTWRSKYLAMKIGLREVMTWKTKAAKQLDEMYSALQDLLVDHDRLWASVACSYSALATLCSQSADGICFIPDKPPHGSVVQIAEVNQKLARCLLTVFGKQQYSSTLLHDRQPIAEPTPAAKKAINVLSSLQKMNNVANSPLPNGGSRDTLVERFHPAVLKPDSDGPLLCKGCKGSIIIL